MPKRFIEIGFWQGEDAYKRLQSYRNNEYKFSTVGKRYRLYKEFGDRLKYYAVAVPALINGEYQYVGKKLLCKFYRLTPAEFRYRRKIKQVIIVRTELLI